MAEAGECAEGAAVAGGELVLASAGRGSCLGFGAAPAHDEIERHGYRPPHAFGRELVFDLGAQGLSDDALDNDVAEAFHLGRGDARAVAFDPVYDEASHALDKVQERNQDWDSDPKWNDDANAED